MVTQTINSSCSSWNKYYFWVCHDHFLHKYSQKYLAAKFYSTFFFLFFWHLVTCGLKIPNKTICTNKNVCKTGARAALSGVEPERSPDRAPGSTHHYTASTSLVLFENVFINVITSIILNTINMFGFLFHFLAFI